MHHLDNLRFANTFITESSEILLSSKQTRQTNSYILSHSQTIVASLMKDGEKLFTKDSKDRTVEFRDNFVSFFMKFTKTCWLVAIAVEEIVVDFDAIGKIYDGDVKAKFERYPMLNKPVFGNPLNSVKTLVWPCLRKADGTIVEMGKVVVVDTVETRC